MNPKTSDQIPDGATRAAEADGSLGQQLRRAREARGISLREISEQTRITMRHLEAIESSDYKHLPGGIFNRSFIKSYAKLIGFPEQRALDLYASEARERGDTEEVATSPRRSHIYMGDQSRSPMMSFALTALALGVIVLMVYAGLHWYRRSGDGPPAPAPSAPAAAPAANPAGQPPAPAAQGAADRLDIKIKAKEEVWLKALVDEEKDKDKQGVTLAADETREFSPGQKLTLKYARSKAGAMEVTINGGAARVPSDTNPNVVQEWVITKDNYRQFLP